MGTWSQFDSLILPDMKDCPTPTIRTAARDAAIAFCEHASVWQEDFSVQVPMGATSGDVDLAPGSAVSALMEVRKGDKAMLPDDFRLTSDSFSIASAATEDSTFLLRVALKPSRAAQDFPDWLFEDWGDVIAAGARARLMAQAGRPWAMPDGVAYNRELFAEGVVRAKATLYRKRLRRGYGVLPFVEGDDWDAFRNMVMSECGDAPLSVLQNATRSAIIDFCARSLVWQDIFTVTLGGGTEPATLLLPSESVAVAVIDAVHGDAAMSAKDFILEGDRISLPSPPTGATAYRVKLALKPTRTAMSCPQWLVEDWAEAIASGAKGRIFGMLKAPWASVEAAAAHLQIFEQGIEAAKASYSSRLFWGFGDLPFVSGGMWDHFRRGVFMEIQGLPLVLAQWSVRSAIIDFCHATRVWQDVLTSVGVTAGAKDVTLTVPDGAEAFQLVDMAEGDHARDVTHYRLADNVFSLDVAREEDTSFTLRVAYKPTPTAMSCPSWIVEQYHDVISAGARAKLYGMAASPWTSPEAQAANAAVFSAGCERVMADLAGRVQVGLWDLPLASGGDWDVIKTHVLRQVRSAPLVAVQTAVRDSLRAFCEKTWIWQERVEGVFASEGDERVEMDIPANTEVVGLVSIMDSDGQSYEVSVFGGIDQKEFILPTAATEDAEYTLTVALQPDNEAVTAPSWLMAEWGEYIAAGALARLCSQLMEPWASADLAGINAAKFKEGLNKASVERWKKKKQASMTINWSHIERY